MPILSQRQPLSDEKIEILLNLKRICPNWTCQRLARIVKSTSGAVSYWLRKDRKRLPRKAPQIDQKRRKKRLALVQKYALAKNQSGNKEFHSLRSIGAQLRLKNKIVVHKSTIARDLKTLNFKCLVRPKCCALPKDYAKRAAFAKGYMNWTPKQAGTLVFSDEKIFTTNDYGHRSEYCAPGERPAPRKRQRWPEARVHVWGAIGLNYKELIIFPEENTFRLTSNQYIRRCLSKIVPHLLSSKSLFMQDGAGCHKGARQYLTNKGVRFITDWPPRSPDLNPIETAWANLQRDASIFYPTCRRSLVTAVKNAWEAMSMSEVNKLLCSFPKRCSEVVKRHGEMCM